MSKKKRKNVAQGAAQNPPPVKAPEPPSAAAETAPKLKPIDWGVNQQQNE